eukprot:jgi/Chrpa1/27347/Chrysochromulina_OHIO_Genome00027407-RA
MPPPSVPMPRASCPCLPMAPPSDSAFGFIAAAEPSPPLVSAFGFIDGGGGSAQVSPLGGGGSAFGFIDAQRAAIAASLDISSPVNQTLPPPLQFLPPAQSPPMGPSAAAAVKAAADKAAAAKAAADKAAAEKAAAEKAAASLINEGAPWDFFMSHVQRESGHDLALITRDLEKAGKEVWLDKYMKDCSTAAMMEGVQHSKTFVLVLSDGYFDSQYCVMELRHAISLDKKIVLCHKQGVNVGAILQRKPPDPEFANIGDKQSLELVTSDAMFIEFTAKRLIDSSRV